MKQDFKLGSGTITLYQSKNCRERESELSERNFLRRNFLSSSFLPENFFAYNILLI